MKRIIVVAVLVAMLVSCQPKERAMAIDFDGTDDKLAFNPNGTVLDNLVNVSVCAWIDIDTVDMDGVQDPIIRKFTSSVNPTWNFVIIGGVEGEKIGMALYYTSSASKYSTAVLSMSGAGMVHVCTTAELNIAANVYKLYFNGVEPEYIDQTTTSGTRYSETGGLITVGSNNAANQTIDGRIYDLRIYNRILTPAEVATIYNMRGKDNIINGLVFRPMLKGAAGLSTFSGALAAGNTIYDPYSNTYGVPVGSPVAVADNQLGW